MSENVEGGYRPEQPPLISIRLRRDPIKDALADVAHVVNNDSPPPKQIRIGPLTIRRFWRDV